LRQSGWVAQQRPSKPCPSRRHLITDLGHFALGEGIGVGRIPVDPSISRVDEFDAAAPIFPVRIRVGWGRWRTKVIKRHKEIDFRTCGGDQILQQEEFDISTEVIEQGEELAISRQRFTKGAVLTQVMPTHAL